MYKSLLIVILIVLTWVSLYGQNEGDQTENAQPVNKMVPFFRDSTFLPDPNLVKEYNPRKALWIPFTEALGLNVGIWAFNRYVTDAHHAYIGWQSIKNNIKNGFDWDADALLVNMWGHPFQGSIYYNMARSSGYGYWPSLGVTAFGSLQWEFFMEVEPPALNDFIMTTFGGAMYGEMFYRFSNLILDESVSGGSRTWREIGAGIFNPGRLFNRLIYGRTNRLTDYRLYQREPNLGELTLGANYVAKGTDFKNADRNQMLAFEYYYGQLFYRKRYKPMDYFNFYTVLNFGGHQPGLGQFRIFGVLTSTQNTYQNGNKILWGLFQTIDYMHNNVYELAGYGAGPAIGFRTSAENQHAFSALLNVSFMPMGGANSDYAPNYKVESLDSARTYNMGAGASSRLEAFWLFPGGDISLKYSFWWLHTMQGAPGDEFVGILQPKARFQIIGRWYLGLQYLLYHRVGKYKDYDDIDMR
ncbi:MAG: DUF3943 domain-containing protein, partial [Calditrichales bacterium]